MSSAFAIIPSPESRENIKIISYDVAAVRDTLSNARLVRDNELVLRVKRSRLEWRAFVIVDDDSSESPLV